MDALNQIFRNEKAAIVAALMRWTGDLDLAEDCFSEASEAALKHWPQSGLPQNPAGWLTTVARRKALDILRRQKVLAEKLPELAETESQPVESDERLGLIFTCCHPSLSREAAVALTLRSLGGLTTPEIARAFLVPEATMAQRLVRAQRKIREAGIPFRVPPPELLDERLEEVMGVLYLIFNEAYRASQGEQLVRVDLAEEAIRLGQMLVDLMPRQPEPLGLLALMCFHHARASARLDIQGRILTLDVQDRSLWDQAAIGRGQSLLERAGRLGRPGPYQLEAAIAALHCLARRAEETDWTRIERLYDSLCLLRPGAVVELNRAVAAAMARGPEVGLELLHELQEPLQDYAHFHATRAELLERTGRATEAADHWRRALELEQNTATRRYLEERLESRGGQQLEAGASSSTSA
ncbi:RNA polymerase sigma factor [bacterium]|nr:RNA polymerase sigma factor [bacterium]